MTSRERYDIPFHDLMQSVSIQRSPLLVQIACDALSHQGYVPIRISAGRFHKPI